MAKDATIVDKNMVKVRLLCVHSGWKVETNPGDVIEVDAAEARRLIDVGGAEAVVEKAGK